MEDESAAWLPGGITRLPGGITRLPDAHVLMQIRESRHGGARDLQCRGECGRPEEGQLCGLRDSKGSDMIQIAYRG